MSPTWSLPSGSSWSQVAANKGKTSNHENWESVLSLKSGLRVARYGPGGSLRDSSTYTAKAKGRKGQLV